MAQYSTNNTLSEPEKVKMADRKTSILAQCSLRDFLSDYKAVFVMHYEVNTQK